MPESASDYNRTKLDNFIIKLKFFSAKALFVKAYGLHSLSHIMHPKYVGTILKGSKMHDLSCRQSLFWSNVQILINHALTRHSYKDFRASSISHDDLLHRLESIEESIILRHILCESETRVKYPLLYAVI